MSGNWGINDHLEAALEEGDLEHRARTTGITWNHPAPHPSDCECSWCSEEGSE